MNAYPEEVYPAVVEILTNFPSTRNSDIKLYIQILKRFHLPTKLEDLDYVIKGDIFATIKRCRQKAQENNPYLAPNENVKENREEMEQTMLDFVRRY